MGFRGRYEEVLVQLKQMNPYESDESFQRLQVTRTCRPTLQRTTHICHATPCNAATCAGQPRLAVE